MITSMGIEKNILKRLFTMTQWGLSQEFMVGSTYKN